MNRKVGGILLALGLSACSATSMQQGAEKIELVNEKPDETKCVFLEEVVGSQGNWLTGKYTSNENLVKGARNVLRNEALRLGGNLVYVQDMKNANAENSQETTNTTAVGKVYRCEK
jgi:hypothetical protein